MNLCVIGTSKLPSNTKGFKIFFEVFISSTRKNSKNLNKISKKFGIKKNLMIGKSCKVFSSFKDTAFL